MQGPLRRMVWVAVFCLGLACSTGRTLARELTFAERVSAQEAIERLQHTHRIGANRPFEEAVPIEVMERRVRDYLRQSAALERIWSVRITPEMLDTELRRITSNTRMPGRLRGLFEDLGNDAFLIRETIARPALVEHLARGRYKADPRAVDRGISWKHWLQEISAELPLIEPTAMNAALTDYREPLPPITGDPATFGEQSFSCEGWIGGRLDSSRPTGRSQTLVWTGNRMLAWGVYLGGGVWDNNGSSYNPLNDSWTEMSAVGAPEARTGHTAVWAGTEMLVWGGVVSQDWQPALNTGGRYDPSTDTWQPMSTSLGGGDIDGHAYHTTVWTGTEMIVWGGCDGVALGYSCATELAGGQTYWPSNDSWGTLPAAPLTRRYGHSAVWTGTEMIVFGGIRAIISHFPFVLSNDGARFNPVTNSWAHFGGPAFAPRAWHSAVWTGTEMLIWGGSAESADPDLNLEPVGGGARYDPAIPSWTLLTTVDEPEPGGGHAVWTGSEMIIWGNVSQGRYDPAGDEWSSISQAGAVAPGPVVWTGDEMIVWNGEGGRYDPATDSWTSMFDLTPRWRHTAVWTGSRMIVWGGSTSTTGLATLDTGFIYDPLLDSVTPTSTASAPQWRVLHTAVWTGSEMIVWGGMSNTNVDLDSGGRYDPVLDTWSATSTSGAPAPRLRQTAVWTGTEMVVWGGQIDSLGGAPLNDGGRYRPDTDSWSSTSLVAAPDARYGHTAVWSGDRMIVWGGWNQGISPPALDNGARYDPALDTWLPVTLSGAPAARWRHTAVWTGDRMIVWGGDAPGIAYANGGRYDPQSDEWFGVSALSAPEQRYSQTAVWNGIEMVVWGGEAFGQLRNTGGRYDPGTDVWIPTTLDGAPEARYDHTAVWSGETMIVFGGRGTSLQDDGSNYFVELTDTDGDGVGDFCDCAPTDPLLSIGPPADVAVLSLEAVSNGGTRVSWPPVDAASSYSLTRGLVSSLLYGDYGACLAEALNTTSATDYAMPSQGYVFGYLVQANSATCGSSSLGRSSDGETRVNNRPGACP